MTAEEIVQLNSTPSIKPAATAPMGHVNDKNVVEMKAPGIRELIIEQMRSVKSGKIPDLADAALAVVLEALVSEGVAEAAFLALWQKLNPKDTALDVAAVADLSKVVLTAVATHLKGS